MHWPGMSNDVKLWCQSCAVCPRWKPGPGKVSIAVLLLFFKMERSLSCFLQLLINLLLNLLHTKVHQNRYIQIKGGSLRVDFFKLSKLLGIEKTRTAYYQLQSDGLVKRLNRTMLSADVNGQIKKRSVMIICLILWWLI